jgi:YbbR domain-containing protein
MVKQLTHNWLLKLLSLVFAVILWSFVMGEQKLEQGYSVPLQLQNVPAGLMVANEVPSLVDVRISGPRTVLMNLRPNDISLTVDLEDLPPGLTAFRRLEERLNIPSALKVTRLSPSFVDVKLERIKEKEVPVRNEIVGKPASGFRVGEVRINPPRVTISGAESELKDISEVGTEEISVDGVRESFTLMVPIVYRGKYAALKNQKTVEILVTIEPLPESGGKTEPKKGIQ